MIKRIRYIIFAVFIVSLLSVGFVSADGGNQQWYYPYGQTNCYNNNCCGYNCYQPQPVYGDRAAFVSDVTIMDGTYIAPGSTFTKTWRVRNNGSTIWTTDYKLVFVNGSQMNGPAYINIPRTVNPGETVDLSVTLRAPSGSGSYRGNWILQNSNGERFGVGYNGMVNVYVQITTQQTPVYTYNNCWNCWNQNPQPRPQPRPQPQPGPRPWNNPWNNNPWQWGTP